MRLFSLLLALLLLGGCAFLPLPRPDPSQAWIDLRAPEGSKLLALEVDEQPLEDPRYFQISPGSHELGMRFQFDVKASDVGANSEALRRDCRLELSYHDFAAGQRYRVEAGRAGFRPWAMLYDQQDRLLVRARESRCGGV
jgi:hypothetical protein